MFGLPERPWIWLPNPSGQDKPGLVLFRRRFLIGELPTSAQIRISADTRYKLYVNGVQAALGPAKGDAAVWYADMVELAPLLRTGENVLAVEVLHYPSHGQTNQSLFHSATPGLYVEDAVSDGMDGEMRFSEIPDNPMAAIYAPKPPAGLDLKADARWKCCLDEGFAIVTENPFFGPLQILEERHPAPAILGWQFPGYDDSAWESAVPYDIMQMKSGVSPANLQPRPIPEMLHIPRRFEGVYGQVESAAGAEGWSALISGTGKVTVAPHATEQVVLTAEEEMTGFLRLSMEGGAGAVVRLLTSEGYVQELGTDMMATHKKGNRADWESGILAGFTDTYYPTGAGTSDQPEVYDPFWFRTFRFLQVEIETGDAPLTLTGLDYLETGYPLEAGTAVTTSDESLSRIWNISLRTLRRCMQETYTDCPFYEQLQYLMDSRSQMLFTYAVSADDRLARQCIEMFSHAQRPDGMLNCSYPNTEPNVIPGFAIYYILMLHDHMMYFGDKDFTRKYLGCIDGILNYFDRHIGPDHLAGGLGSVNMGGKYWSFIDWSPAWETYTGMPPAGMVGPLTAENLLYVLGLQKAAEINEWVGRKDTAAEYRTRAAAVQEAVNQLCRDDKGFYLDGPGVKQYSQHSQIFAILTDTVPAEEGRALLAAAMDDPQTFATCSIAMYYYLFRALEKTGSYEHTAQLWDLWRDMLKNNLTTCVENDTSQRSDCHAWGATALYELPAVTLGVRPGAPGYEKIIIRPVPGYLDWAKGEVMTKWGKVSVEWKKEPNGNLSIRHHAPNGVEVIF